MTREIITGANYDNVDIAQTYELFVTLKPRSFSTKSKRPNFGCKVQSYPTDPTRQAQFFTGGGVGTAAEATVEIVPFGSEAPAVGTKVVIGLPCSIGGEPAIVYAGYIVQTSDTKALVAAGVKAAWDCVIDPTNTLPTGGFIRCSNRNASETDISAAIVALFGSDEDAAVDATGAVLTFTFGSTGTAGNDQEIITQVMSSLPDPLPEFADGICTNIPGLISMGSAVGLTDTKGATTVDLVNDLIFSSVKLPGRATPQLQYQMHELVRDFLKRSLLGQTEDYSQDGTSDYLVNDGQPQKVKTAAFLAVQRGTFVSGKPDYIYSIKNTFSFDSLNYTTGQVPASQVTVAPQLTPGSPIIVKQGQLEAALTF